MAPSKALVPGPVSHQPSLAEERITRAAGTVILLLGRSGVGKSHFINVAAGKRLAPVSDSLTPAAELDIRHFVVDNPSDPQSSKLILVDTPGFDNYNHELSDVAILRRISEWLTTRCSLDAKFGGVIYFHDITQDRGALEYTSRIWPASHLAAPEPVRHLLLATVKWDYVTGQPHADNYERRQELLSATVWKQMLMKGARVERFLNTTDSAWTVLSKLLELQPLELHILQRDLARLRSINPGGTGKRKSLLVIFSRLMAKFFRKK